jgi:hypothetical protein
VATRVAALLAAMGLLWTLLLAGIGFSLVALYTWLAITLVPAAAAGITGGLAITASVIGLSIARARVPGSNRGVPVAAAGAGQDVIRRYPMESALAALAAGLMVANVPDVGKLLTDQLLTLAKKNLA